MHNQNDGDVILGEIVEVINRLYKKTKLAMFLSKPSVGLYNTIYRNLNSLDEVEKTNVMYIVNKISNSFKGTITDNKLSKSDATIDVNGQSIKVIKSSYVMDKNTIINTKDTIIKDLVDDDQVFFDVYYLKKDFEINELTLQEDEVDFCEWASCDKIKSLINNGLFLKSHAEDFLKTLDILKENK